MNTRISPFAATGAALATVGALVVATPAIGANLDVATASTARLNSLYTPFELLSKSHWQGAVGGYDSEDSDDDHGYSEDNESDDDHGGRWGGGGNFIADFLANNQATVLAVTALIPVIYLGPVAVGNSLLATAYYDGYNGSATGLPGIVSYVTAQFGVPSNNLVQGIVLGLTSLIPQFNIGPVAVGNSLLATAYFSGYNGSATGLPGVISYVTSQLGLAPAPAAAVTAGDVTAAVASTGAAATVKAARTVPAAAAASKDSGSDTAVTAADVVSENDSTAGDSAASTGAGTADTGSAADSAGRGSAKAAPSKARAARSAARGSDS